MKERLKTVLAVTLIVCAMGAVFLATRESASSSVDAASANEVTEISSDFNCCLGE